MVPVQARTHPARPVDLRASVDISEAWPDRPDPAAEHAPGFRHEKYLQVVQPGNTGIRNLSAAMSALREARSNVPACLRYYVEISKRF